MRIKRNKVERAAKDVGKDIKKAAKKKGFISRTISSSLMLGVIGAGVKYFTDATAGAARRQKVLSLVGKS